MPTRISAGARSTGLPPPSRPTAPGATVPARARAVLDPLDRGAPRPDPEVLAGRLRPLLAAKALGPNVSAVVVDAATGGRLAALSPDVARSPASTAKLLTAAAALTALGPEHTVATRAVRGATGGDVVLVGGGDVLLAAGAGQEESVNGHAGFADLAAQTARSLRGQGRARIRLRLDDSLFSGPATSDEWESTDVSDGFVAPIMALEVNRGRSSGSRAAQDPALSAASSFAVQLRRRGVTVLGPIRRARAGAGAPVLGEVRSAPVGDLVEYILTESDNTVAEALARLVSAEAGREATFADSGAAVLAQVEGLGVSTAGAVLFGGSGLAKGSRLPAHLLTGVLVLAASPTRAQLRPLLTGLPVAGASGTLADRFDGAEGAGAGAVRAKTGTLRGVSSLAGTVIDVDGRQLAFAVLADRVRSTVAARRGLDRVATALAGCGCR